MTDERCVHGNDIDTCATCYAEDALVGQQTLEEVLAELERTDPEVRAAVEQLELTKRRIIRQHRRDHPPTP